MIYKQWILFFLGALVPIISSVQGRCSSTQFPCHNTKCIPQIWVCDEEDDCGDHSDEDICAKKTCSETEHTCQNGKCIPKRWLCDGDDDCQDNSDESQDVCINQKCQSNQMTCGDSGQCIPINWHCDGQNDCPGGEDELNCTPTTCAEGEFRCNDSKCITERWRCDQDSDCDDNSDEEGCAPATCESDQFSCDEKCIPMGWKCDGTIDCHDNTDEENCNVDPGENLCADQEFMCANGKCIHASWQCDNDEDCLDGSDERNCTGVSHCRDSQFSCHNDSVCIPAVMQCDGQRDCKDGSDEIGCQPEVTSCDPHTQFDCNGNGKLCIDASKVCDHTDDCGNSQDEKYGPGEICNHRNPCNDNKGGCLHECHFNHFSKYCTCRYGFKLASNGLSCEDVDECKEEPPVCSQTCENTKGSYKCSCEEGYMMDMGQNGRCRVATGGAGKILFANRHDIREINLQTHEYRAVLNGTRSAIAIDYDYNSESLYYSDVAQEKLCRAPLKHAAQCDIIVDTRISTPDGICFDWVHHNVYWSDTGHNVISVKSLSQATQHRKTLIASGNLDEPRALVADPRPGQQWLYWTDWGENAKIERAGLDGSNRMTLLGEDDVQWPNGLAIDFTTNRLFWVDAKLHLIGSARLDGSNMRNVLINEDFLQHPFALDVFEDWVYWTDWETEAIYKTDKHRGIETKAVAQNLFSPMDIHIYHATKQPTSLNVCGLNNGGCSQLCLPSPSLSSDSPKYVCACADGHPESPECSTQQVPLVPHPSTTSPEATTQSATGTGNSSRGTPVDQRQFGEIAGIVFGFLALVIIITALIGCIVYKSILKKNTKSMNFDNPVYRKTTEDQFCLEKDQYQPTAKDNLEPLTLTHEVV